MRFMPFVKGKKGFQMAGGGVSDSGGGGGGSYVLPVASANTLGGVKVGEGLSITPEGVLSSSGGGDALVVADTETEVGTFGNTTLYSRRFDITNVTGTDIQVSIPALSHCYVKLASFVSDPTTSYNDVYYGNITKFGDINSATPRMDVKLNSSASATMHFDLTVFYIKVS